MRHLKDETLARLVDEESTEEEALHLASCTQCSAELDALRLQTRAVGALPELEAPTEGWASLKARLEDECLIATARGKRPWVGSGALRVAAGIALFVMGMAAGGLVPRVDRSEAPAAVPSVAGVQDAEQRLREAEAAYLNALTAYSEASGSASAIDPLNRLTALEGIVLTTQAALAEAPADPLINGYHLSALGQREAILRQIDASTEEEIWY